MRDLGFLQASKPYLSDFLMMILVMKAEERQRLNAALRCGYHVEPLLEAYFVQGHPLEIESVSSKRCSMGVDPRILSILGATLNKEL